MEWCDHGKRECPYKKGARCEICGCVIELMRRLGKPCPLETLE